MLHIVIPEKEYWNERINEFVYTKQQSLCLEHSLVSVSKWESNFHKSFLHSWKNNKITHEEIEYYVKCMTLTQNVDPTVYKSLSRDNMKTIFQYMEDPMTATTFRDEKGGRSRQIITSELIYSWMVYYGIPFECQKWHLNRLMTLIRVCSSNNEPRKKKKPNEIMAENAALNAIRRSKLGSKG